MGSTIALILLILFIGINLAANRRFNSYIVSYLFYNDTMSLGILRLLGVAVLSTIVLIILHMEAYALLVNMLVFIIFIFFSIQGRTKAKRVREQKRYEQEKAYKEEMERKKMEIQRIRTTKKKEMEKTKNKSKSVKEIKEKMWDDGTMTNKELIQNFHKDK